MRTTLNVVLTPPRRSIMRTTLRPLASLCLLALACRPAPMQPVAQPEPAIVVAPEPAPAPAPAPPEPETWVGTVEPRGATLDIILRLQPDPDKPGKWRGRLDIPMQGIKDYPLEDVDLDAEGLEFSLAPPGSSEAQRAVFVAAREPNAATAQGELNQNGMSFPLKLRRLAPGESPDVGPKRPQEPKPPFPYSVREVGITSEVDGVTLAGTLTAPADGARHPAVVLLTGSGAQDRDESILGHKPFLVLADHLTRSGVVVLRYDDRGVGGSGGFLANTSHETLRRDASTALTWLQGQPEVDPTRIGLIGHSEGANIAIVAAAADKRVAFLVLLAGMGVSGKQILPMQMAALLRAGGAAEDALPPLIKLENKLIAAVMKKAPRAELEQLARELTRRQLEQSKPPTPVTAEQLETLVKAGLAAFETEAFRSLLQHDPRPVLRKLKVTPVLALNGSLDLQVPATENLGEIEKALRAAKNKDVTIKQLPGLNHLFQHARTGQVEEYSKIEETLAPELLQEVSGWISAHTTVK
jgi:hypothetical protein